MQPKLKALGENLVDRFALLAGGILLFVGAASVVGAFADAQNLDIADPVLGIPFRRLMLAFGLTQLVVSFALLFVGKRILGIGLAIWISTSFLVYRAELWSEGWRHSSGFMIPQLGFSVRGMDVVLSFLSVFLLVGSCIVLFRERILHLKAEYPKMSCPACGVHIRFPVEKLGQNTACPKCSAAITLRKPEEKLKMSCYFCNGHIEFPSHALGTKMACPHCNMDITLKESA